MRAGGAAGGNVREADILATVDTRAEVLRIVTTFLQYYRENADYKERTYDFIPLVGLEKMPEIIMGRGDRRGTARAAADRQGSDEVRLPRRRHPAQRGPLDHARRAQIAIFRAGGGWYALDAVCPHMGGPLADGIVCDRAVICPLYAPLRPREWRAAERRRDRAQRRGSRRARVRPAAA